ncbi:hypothetical protein FLK61_36145 [Paenalkalicoccus suaedae]|uniref:Uncharacterized protein n=1 Tax=Paenalkalicoccus suaedae TaxID=2592382 RepID=A0A859FIN2_9BACI|nr:hypothetical protein [Paenalkalicoccus suaedae]QKS72095.1 hypothetical protein FLK61_36145 [Paenalkalicoccus suaedae]
MLRLFPLLLITFFLVGCDMGNEQALNEVVQALEANLDEEPQTTTTRHHHLNLYLPEDATVEEIDEQTYMLTMSENVYILFLDSPVEDQLINEDFSTDEAPVIAELGSADRTGKLVVNPFDKETYEVVVNIDTVSLMSVMHATEMKDETTLMLDIVKSVQKK